MANEQGWQDFRKIIKTFMIVPGKINELSNRIDDLKELKIEILDDAGRLAEITEIIGIHPLYTIAGLQAAYTKLVALQQFLIDNGYL